MYSIVVNVAILCGMSCGIILVSDTCQVICDSALLLEWRVPGVSPTCM